MARLQRAFGLLRALSPCIHRIEQHGGRRFATHVEQVAPAVTNIDIQDEWYLRQRSQISLGNRLPHVAVSAWVAPSAVVVGDVDLLDRVSVWNNVVLRGDLNNITIGQIGKYVTIEPNCALRSCRIGDYVKLQPGSVLPPTRRVPSGELWGGVPAQFIRELTEDEQEALRAEADEVRRLAWHKYAEELPHGTAWRGVEAHRASLVGKGDFVEVPLRRLKYDARKREEFEESNALAATAGSSSAIK
eukprot:gene4900-5144_t